MRQKLCGALLAVGLLVGLSGPAAADIIFDIGASNTALGPYPGPFVHVDIHLNVNGTATVTATGLTNSGFIYLMGGVNSFGLNTNGAVSVGAIVGNPLTTFSIGSGNVSAFGNFDFVINSDDGFGHASNSLSFTLTKTTGSWATENDILVANNKGFLGEAHIFVSGPNCKDSKGVPIACVTGFAGNGGGGPPVQDVPEPGVLSLLGIGLLALGTIALRRRQG